MMAAGAYPDRCIACSDEDFQPRARQLTSPADWKSRRARTAASIRRSSGCCRPPHSDAPRASRAAVPGHGPGGAVVRRAVVGRLRDRGNPARAGRRRARRRSSSPTPIGLLIATLLALVAFSYRQTIHAYPSGGGAYIVAKDNIGEMPALIAAAALLIDYTLTVAVSIAAGVAALTSAFPALHVNRVELSLGVPRRPDDRQPARHPRIGAHLRRPDLLLHRHDSRC